MPTYEYLCQACGKTFTRVMSFAQYGQRPRPACPKCNSSKKIVQRVSSFQVVTAKKT